MDRTKLLVMTFGVGAVYACMWAIFFVGIYPPDTGEHQNTASLAGLIMLGIQIPFFLLFVSFKRVPAPLLLATASLCTASLAAYYFVSPLNLGIETVLLFVSGIAFGVFRPLATVCWFDYMRSMEYREVQDCSAMAICLASSLVLFFLAVNQMVANVIVSLLPVASALALFWIRGERKKGEAGVRFALEGFEEIARCAKLVPASLLLEILVVSVANGYIRGVNVFGEVEGTVLVFSAVCVCCVVVSFAKTLKSIYSISIVLVTVGLTLLAASEDTIGYSLIAFGQIGISVIAWIACVAIAKKNNVSSGIVGGFTWAILTLGQVLGNGAGMFVTASTSAGSSLGVSVPMVIGLFSMMLLVLTINKPFLSIIYDEEKTLKMDAALANRVQDLRKQYNLTARETEVFEMLAQGRNAKYITNKLSISPNTTKTHIRNIYIKMGISDHQELLSRLET